MTTDLHDKLNMLERTVLELGTEVYSLKGTLAKQKEAHTRFLSIVRGLKQLFDEKGLITIEDFEGAVELGEAIERTGSQHDALALSELEKMKKSH